MERLDRILANLGYCGRRQAADFLRDHLVVVDGGRVRDGAMKADPHAVSLDGEALDHPDGIFVLLNKPAGYVCSHDPAEGRRIYELLPARWMRRNPAPSTVGRLDKDTTGVILVTDQTRIIHRLSSPRSCVDKVYRARLDKPPPLDCAALFASGTLLLPGESKPCLPAELRRTGEVTAEVTIREGRYHQVKRMFAKCGCEVLALHRSRFGKYSDEGVKEGEFVEPDLGAEV